MEKAMMNTIKILVIELEKVMIRRPPRADQVDLHAICSECLLVQQGFDCRLWFLMKKIPTMHKINKIKKLLPLTHSCDSSEFKLWFLMKETPTMQKINKIKIKLLHKLLPLSINYKTHSCDSFQFKS